MNFSTKLATCTVLICLVLLTSCASTKITGQWKNPQLADKKFSSILVIGVAKQPDRRKFYEDEFARQLSREGIMAVASHTIIPRDKMQDRSTIAKTIDGLNVDCVLITRLQGIKEQDRAAIDKPYKIPYGFYNNIYEYYNTSFSIAPSRSVAETHTYLQLETNIYDAATEMLVYSITTDTFIREKFQGRITAYIETVVRQLKKNNLI